jgi:hypothetical protein
MISRRMKAIAGLTAAAVALTTSAPAFAGPTSQAGVSSHTQATEFSSRDRGYGNYPRYRNDAAAAAMVGAIISGVAAYAAAREYRKARERSYYGQYDGQGPYAPNGYYPSY